MISIPLLFYLPSEPPVLKQTESNSLIAESSPLLQSIPMATPPADQPNRDVVRRQKKGAPIKFLVPLIYAPALPLIRLTLRHKPVLRDRLFTAVLAGAFAHGFYLVTDIYDAESK